MTLEDKRARVNAYCASTDCEKCVLKSDNIKTWKTCGNPSFNCLEIYASDEEDLDKALALIENICSETGKKLAEDFVEGCKSLVNNPVNRPAHYTDGNIEVIDFIEDKKLGFCLGNAVKYIARAGKKDPTKEVQDLEKAIWYVNRRIKQLQEAK